MGNSHDFEIRAGGVPCVRFENPGIIHRRVLAGEFGEHALSPATDRDEPLVTVCFRPVEPPPRARLVGRSSCVADEHLFVREGTAWVSLPIQRLLEAAAPLEVVAAPAYDVVRLVGYILEPLAKVRALLRGHAFVHSSAVAINGRAVLLCAWGNTGKTNLMLQLAHAGAQMLSDDWSLVRADGAVAGYPRPVNLMNYNLDVFPALRSHLSARQKLLYYFDRAFRRSRQKGGWSSPRLLRAADMVERLLELAANARIPLGRFEANGAAGLRPSLILEVHKLPTGSAPEFVAMSAEELVRTATVCFAYESLRLLQRLAECAYAAPGTERFFTDILSRYSRVLAANLARAGTGLVHSLGLPARPTVEQLKEAAGSIWKLARDGQEH